MDDGAGASVADTLGLYSGAIEGDVSWAAGQAGGALSFNGGQVRIPKAMLETEIDPVDAVTVSMWINPTQFGNYKSIFDTQARSLSLWFDTATGGWMGVGGNSNSGATFTPGWTTGQWQHLGLRFDNATHVWELYRNAQLCSRLTNTSGANFWYDWVLGGNPSGPVGGTSRYLGLMDDVQVYDTALSPQDIAWLAANPGQALPEPATAMVLVAGAALCLLRRRRAA